MTLANPDMMWRPGLFINVELHAEPRRVPVAVRSEAVQKIDEQPTVFIRVPGGFVAQPVTIGLSDDHLSEIVSGVQRGAQYAVAGSFIIKSELGKSSAEHVH